MNEKHTEIENSIFISNAIDESNQNTLRGWFVGHFIDPAYKLKCTHDVEIKWGEHRTGETRPVPIANVKATTLTLLIKGSFVVEFPDLKTSVNLKRTGDYVIFAPFQEVEWSKYEYNYLVAHF